MGKIIAFSVFYFSILGYLSVPIQLHIKHKKVKNNSEVVKTKVKKKKKNKEFENNNLNEWCIKKNL